MKKFFQLTILFAFAGILYFFWQSFSFLFLVSGNPKHEIIFEVTPGMNFHQVSTRLVKEKIIYEPFKFNLLARIGQFPNRIRVGEYSLNNGMSPLNILQILASGKSIDHSLTIQEGLNMYEIAELLENTGLGSKKDFLKLCEDKDFIHSLLGEAYSSFEGYLFPETYKITKYSGAKTLIKQMVRHFNFVYNEVIQKSNVKMKKHDIVILASIIEKETGAPEERPIISSVFHNRLRKNMRLQTDPTILYGILDKTKIMKKNITRKDITTYSKYNTYRFKGLPKGPIANPGRDALLATVTPQKTNFLYFVSRNNGTHFFSKSFAEHNKAVRKFQLSRRARKGKSWRDRLKKKQE